MDMAAERYALDVASATAAVFGSKLAGVYLHGSAVLGGFDARRSDVDVLVVCDGPMTAAQQRAVAGALSEQRLSCPGRGLELSIVTVQAARHPAAEPAFELHLTIPRSLMDTSAAETPIWSCTLPCAAGPGACSVPGSPQPRSSAR